MGEAERQLRLLFDQAKRMQPSIIFFDEIDGLAPVRSQKQDQIHSSIVSTLLALMDGLDKRGQVIVIGATNRVDAIDPALRRPGRFDRELMFTLPNRVRCWVCVVVGVLASPHGSWGCVECLARAYCAEACGLLSALTRVRLCVWVGVWVGVGVWNSVLAVRFLISTHGTGTRRCPSSSRTASPMPRLDTVVLT